MSSAGSESHGSRARGRLSPSTVDVYLACKQVAVLRSDGSLWVRATSQVGEAMAALSEELGRTPADGGSRVAKLQVWFGASLSRPVRLAAVASTLSTSERRRVSEAAATNLAGLPGPVRVWLDAPEVSGARLAVVVEQAVLDSLYNLAAALRARLMSVRPLWAEVLKAVMVERPATQALAVWEGGALTLLAGVGDTISVARTSMALHDTPAAHAAYLRACIGEGIDQDASLAVSLDFSVDAIVRHATDGNAVLSSIPFGAWITALESQP